jgi:hypothetical protein
MEVGVLVDVEGAPHLVVRVAALLFPFFAAFRFPHDADRVVAHPYGLHAEYSDRCGVEMGAQALEVLGFCVGAFRGDEDLLVLGAPPPALGDAPGSPLTLFAQSFHAPSREDLRSSQEIEGIAP